MSDSNTDSSPRSGATAPETTVLIVDDEAAMTEILSTWVGERHATLVAADGQEALDVVTGDVDVVLLDRRMPRMGGDEFLLELKEQGYDARVVMVTAVDPGPDIVSLPFDDYITKPVTKDVVLNVIDRMLHLRKAGKAVREYHSLERRRDVLRTARQTTGVSDSEAFELLTRRLEAAAKDAGAGLAWLKEDYYETDR
ncbi:response regulator transcription factor [Haloglomus salinum]|jgi:CheY-like chemotaxis protein|uniref:response regulator transcription factor n=1 Tax=Haloglomus salinum TaxID=2962673 RepID=UPI0020C9839B|nr:response regulator [Haloglomus salinum]